MQPSAAALTLTFFFMSRPNPIIRCITSKKRPDCVLDEYGCNVDDDLCDAQDDNGSIVEIGGRKLGSRGVGNVCGEARHLTGHFGGVRARCAKIQDAGSVQCIQPQTTIVPVCRSVRWRRNVLVSVKPLPKRRLQNRNHRLCSETLSFSEFFSHGVAKTPTCAEVFYGKLTLNHLETRLFPPRTPVGSPRYVRSCRPVR